MHINELPTSFQRNTQSPTDVHYEIHEIDKRLKQPTHLRKRANNCDRYEISHGP